MPAFSVSEGKGVNGGCRLMGVMVGEWWRENRVDGAAGGWWGRSAKYILCSD